jgi:hypothetical protein
LSKYPEILLITSLHTTCRLEVGKMYQVEWVSTDKHNENETFFLKGSDGNSNAISKNQFEFVEIKIEAKIV